MADAPNVPLSSIIFGTMRMPVANRTLGEWVAFFVSMHEMGVRKLHSSTEYESFPLLCEVMKAFREARPDLDFKHIVKLGDPSFDDLGYDHERFAGKVRTYCAALGTDHIDDIQWMWRSGLKDDASRIGQFLGSQDALSHSVSKVKADGLIGRMLCFPYSPAFAMACADYQNIDGLVVYRNVQEREYDEAIARCAGNGKASLIIRPFNAGKAFEGATMSANQLLTFALDMPSIEAAIVSTSHLQHLREAVGLA